MDDVFRALADPSRRLLLDQLRRRNGQSLTELCAGLTMARQSVTKHLAVLEGANLVTTVRQGRQKLHFLNPVPINEIADRWIHHYDVERVRALSDLKLAMEGAPVSEPKFVYTTYIRTTPERLWEALTAPAFTSRYWGTTFTTDWKAGSTIDFTYAGVTITDPAQVVLESDPYHRLSYTWHTITDAFADAVGFEKDQKERFQQEPRSKVTFELEEMDEVVKLTVVHDGFQPGSEILEGISEGWPAIISRLKTLLEVDEPSPVGT